MRRVIGLYQTSVGKKVVMAATGGLMLLFVIAHMVGNLKVYQGQEKFDAYAHWLREMGAPFLAHGEALWLARIVLIAAVGMHLVTATQLTLMSWRARDVPYRKEERLGFSYASYTMRWGGVVVGFYVVYHLLHLTWGTVHHDFDPASPYHNVVAGFRVWWIALVYALAMLPLGLHVYHGIWSAMQTLGVNNPGYTAWRRPVAAAVALMIVAGYLSIPIAVSTGLVR